MFSSVYCVSAKTQIDFFNLPEDDVTYIDPESAVVFGAIDVLNKFTFGSISFYSSETGSGSIANTKFSPSVSMPPSTRRFAFTITAPYKNGIFFGSDGGTQVRFAVTSPYSVARVYFLFDFAKSWDDTTQHKTVALDHAVNSSGVIDFTFNLIPPDGYSCLLNCTISVYFTSNNSGAGTFSFNNFEILEPATNQDIIDSQKEEGEKTREEIQKEGDKTRDEIKAEGEKNREEIKNQTEEQKGMFAKLFENISNFFKNLFFPPEGYFDDLLADLNDYFGERFGFLYFPFEIMIRFLNIMSSSSAGTDTVITIPALEFQGFTLLESTTFSFYEFRDQSELFRDIHGLYRSMVSIIIGLWFINLSYKQVKAVFAN